MFFAVGYLHIGRGLYYGSFMSPRAILWCVGVIIFFVMFATAFIGYVLPWGQMSFWGATVITNMASAIPYVGSKLVAWLWGGFSVGNPTLTRFFSLHYLLPFIIAALVIVHIAALHVDGSNNPMGMSSEGDKIPFHPYYTWKDIYGVIAFIGIFAFFLYLGPNWLGHSDNYLEADPLVTPLHIVPEWYFLAQYAILRGIPNKLLGVIALIASILILLTLPVINASQGQSNFLRVLNRLIYTFFMINFIFLIWLGGQPAEDPFVLAAQLSSFFYFVYFLVLIPIYNVLEQNRIVEIS